MQAARPAAGPDPARGVGPAIAAKNPAKSSVSQVSAAVGLCGALLVTRCIGGVEVTQRAPRARFRGIVLSLCNSSDFCDVLLAAVGGADIPLARIEDEEAVAIWRGKAKEFGLPLILRREDGEEVAMDWRVGAISRGFSGTWRRKKPLARRRPRFLMRRKSARLPLAPAVHRGREITATR